MQIFERHFQLYYSVGVHDGFTLVCLMICIWRVNQVLCTQPCRSWIKNVWCLSSLMWRDWHDCTRRTVGSGTHSTLLISLLNSQSLGNGADSSVSSRWSSTMLAIWQAFAIYLRSSSGRWRHSLRKWLRSERPSCWQSGQDCDWRGGRRPFLGSDFIGVDLRKPTVAVRITFASSVIRST